MKFTKLLVSLVVVGASTVASAQTVTQTPAVSITLQVLKNCVINTGLAGVTGLSVAPVMGNPTPNDFVSSPDTANFSCTTSTGYTVDVAKQAALTGAGSIPYSAKIFSSTAPAPGVAVATGAQSGTGTGGGMSLSQRQTVSYKYTILEADYLNAPPGAYADTTLALKITY